MNINEITIDDIPTVGPEKMPFNLMQCISALRLEVRTGMKMSRGSVLAHAQHTYGATKRTKKGALAELEALYTRLTGREYGAPEWFTTLDEVVAALDAGHRVCWKQDNYQLERWQPTPLYPDGSLEIVCTNNDNAVGLYWRDGVTSDYQPGDFYIADPAALDG